MKPLTLVVTQYTLSYSGNDGPTLELVLRYDVADRTVIEGAAARIRLTNTLDPLLYAWLARLPASERIRLITEAVSDRLTETDVPDGH